MIRTPEFKLIKTRGRGAEPPFELYDLKNDPGEDVNLAGNSRYAKIQADLAKQLDDWLAESAPLPKMSGVRTTWSDQPVNQTKTPTDRRERQKKKAAGQKAGP